MKSYYVLTIKEPLRLGFETLERAQAFTTILDGAVKKADGLFTPEIKMNEYPVTEKDNEKF